MSEQAAEESARRQAMNQAVIDEFRGNAGVVGGFHAQIPLLLLHHVGAKSGAPYVTPLAYLEAGDAFVLMAANGGRDRHPGWYHNLVARPLAAIEINDRTIAVTAREAEGEEWERLSERARQESQLFEGFESRTARHIPILVLDPISA
ncbi:nitroreductase/quinone reductase family protein [Actinospica robiniae]|uniref:nitroreductase/quinone reductase family protein n=1 Tax=Actinospica robiniae TaxID=304901 RepID=UPI000405E859|nr:nitroreductase/quinone reductase family protein [Actinospica robiniae]